MNALTTIFNPGILFFLLGFVAALLRSNLNIPESVVKFLTFYLMVSIGFKGGVGLYYSSLFGDGLLIIGIVLLMSALVPLYAFAFFRRKFGTADAAAIGATYGSNSTLTYITAAGFLTSMGVAFEGYMTVALVVMETPAIILAIIMARATGEVSGQKEPTHRIIAGALTDGSLLLLVGSLIIGYLLKSLGAEESPLSTFISGDMFTGMLIFFLLYMGTVVGQRLRELNGFPLPLAVFAVGAPILNATIAISLSRLFGFSAGDALLLTVLCSSASYIVAPAILRDALPEADPAKFLTMSLGITFPLNIVFGIPVYWWIISRMSDPSVSFLGSACLTCAG
ncbi:MAG: sodium-dependent bicarbonate transport family permease [Opitutales bacterium]|nr:sodium-dependent bicarbonate transport family permease [Opitutales bacterium]